MSIAERGLGRLLILMGIVGIGIAFFLAPWVTVDLAGTNVRQEKGLDLGLYGVPIIAGLALATFVVGLSRQWRKMASIGAVLAGLAGIGYVIFTVEFGTILGGLVDAHPGPAFWVSVAGFVAILLGGVIEWVAE